MRVSRVAAIHEFRLIKRFRKTLLEEGLESIGIETLGGEKGCEVSSLHKKNGDTEFVEHRNPTPIILSILDYHPQPSYWLTCNTRIVGWGDGRLFTTKDREDFPTHPGLKFKELWSEILKDYYSTFFNHRINVSLVKGNPVVTTHYDDVAIETSVFKPDRSVELLITTNQMMPINQDGLLHQIPITN